MATTTGAFELPAGWRREDLPYSTHCAIYHAPADAGMVTVDFERRLFRLGFSLQGPKASQKSYAGRGWRDELSADAVALLANTLGISNP